MRFDSKLTENNDKPPEFVLKCHISILNCQKNQSKNIRIDRNTYRNQSKLTECDKNTVRI